MKRNPILLVHCFRIHEFFSYTMPLNFLFHLFVLFHISAQITFFCWYCQYFSKGLSSGVWNIAGGLHNWRFQDLSEPVRVGPKECWFVMLALPSPCITWEIHVSSSKTLHKLGNIPSTLKTWKLRIREIYVSWSYQAGSSQAHIYFVPLYSSPAKKDIEQGPNEKQCVRPNSVFVTSHLPVSGRKNRWSRVKRLES